MERNPVETVMGAVVLVLAGLFLAFAYSTADLEKIEGYSLSARFAKVGGLKVGADVRISGIKVGTVMQQSLDSKTYQAVITMNILPAVRLPVDTTASVASDGLLGGSYLKLDPGTAENILPEGAVISRVRDFQSLEDLVGQVIFLATQDPVGRQAPAPENR